MGGGQPESGHMNHMYFSILGHLTHLSGACPHAHQQQRWPERSETGGQRSRVASPALQVLPSYQGPALRVSSSPPRSRACAEAPTSLGGLSWGHLKGTPPAAIYRTSSSRLSFRWPRAVPGHEQTLPAEWPVRGPTKTRGPERGEGHRDSTQDPGRDQGT